MDKALKLVPYDPAWPRDFDAERNRIAAVAGVLAPFTGRIRRGSGISLSGSSSARSRRVIRTGYEAPSSVLVLANPTQPLILGARAMGW